MSGINPTFLALGLGVGILLLFLTAVDRRAAMLGLITMLFMSSIGVATDYRGNPWIQWMYPLQEQRNIVLAGVSLGTFACGWLLLPPSSVGGAVRPLLYLMLLGVLMGLIRGIHAGVPDAVLTILLAILTFGAVTLVAGRGIDQWDDLDSIPRVVALSALLSFAATAVQLVLDPSRAFIGNTYRFIGMGANPQFMACRSAFQVLCAIWLFYYGSIVGRVLWVIIAVLGVGVIAATGSRTGLLLLTLGLGIISVRRLGRVVIVIPVIGLSIFLLTILVDAIGISLPFSRLISGDNTREQAWGILVNQFLSSPIIGVGTGTSEKSENSVLYAAASYGIFAAACLVAFVIWIISRCVTMVRRTRDVPDVHRFVDLFVAMLMMYLAGSIFEGYMIARVSPMPIFCGLALLGLGKLDWLLDESADAPDELDAEEQAE
jgi:O-antigen ligase